MSEFKLTTCTHAARSSRKHTQTNISIYENSGSTHRCSVLTNFGHMPVRDKAVLETQHEMKEKVSCFQVPVQHCAFETFCFWAFHGADNNTETQSLQNKNQSHTALVFGDIYTMPTKVPEQRYDFVEALTHNRRPVHSLKPSMKQMTNPHLEVSDQDNICVRKHKKLRTAKHNTHARTHARTGTLTL